MIDLRFDENEIPAVRRHIEDFIREQVKAAGVDGVVIGLSGGIDSSLVAYLAADALGSDSVRGLSLPASVSSSESTTDAEHVATELGIEFDEFDIAPIVDTVCDGVLEAADDTRAVGNVRARIRAVLNYFVANHDDRLVLGTGNRSEAAVGYFTKYGDGAVDCNPIAILYKQQVRQLARQVGVPEQIVEKPPSAELWGGQTDEGELGITYDVLDAILVTHIDGPLSAGATARLLEIEESTVDRIRSLYEASEHKRRTPAEPQPFGY